MGKMNKIIFTIASDLINNTDDLQIVEGEMYIIASKNNDFVEEVFGNTEENVALINCMFSGSNKNYKKNKFYEEKYNSSMENLARGYDVFSNLKIGDVVSFANSIQLSIIKELSSSDLIVVEFTGLGWDSITETVKLAKEYIKSNKNKAILFFQGDTDKYTFPTLILEKIEQEQFDLQEWVKRYGSPADNFEFKAKI